MIEIPNVNLNSDTPALKFLDVFFDPLLNFIFHINYVTIKLSRALYFLRTAKNNLTFAARKLLYYSLFHSNLMLYMAFMNGPVQHPRLILVFRLKMLEFYL
jgi:hypothetical protein